MEIPSPLILLYAFSTSPLATAPNFSLTSTNPTATFLLVLFLTHYANRAIVSPLRTPTRSRIHWMIPLVAVGFNTLNAYLIGSWLGSGVVQPDAWRRSPAFWIGIGMFAVGFVGNVWHDEILIRIRREKMREEEETAAKGKGGKPHYAIPYGGMYRFISWVLVMFLTVIWSLNSHPNMQISQLPLRVDRMGRIRCCCQRCVRMGDAVLRQSSLALRD